MAEAKGKYRWKQHMPISVRGQVFASAHDVAEHFGLKVNTVYWMVYNNRADRIGLGKGKHTSHISSKARLVYLGDTVYPSARAAWRATGIPYKRILQYMKGERDDICTDRGPFAGKARKQIQKADRERRGGRI